MFSFWGIFGGAAGLALVHGILPNHWLPFVAVSRSRHWPRSHTLAVTALGAGLHVLVTAALGFLLAWLAKGAASAWGEVLKPASGLGLFGFGVGFIVADLTRGHRHQHAAQDLLRGNKGRGEALILGSLLLYLTLSPCEALLPLFAVGYSLTWFQLLLVALAVAVVTISTMTVMVGLVLHGMGDKRLKALEERELLIFGSLLVLMSIAAFI